MQKLGGVKNMKEVLITLIKAIASVLLMALGIILLGVLLIGCGVGALLF